MPHHLCQICSYFPDRISMITTTKTRFCFYKLLIYILAEDYGHTEHQPSNFCTVTYSILQGTYGAC